MNKKKQLLAIAGLIVLLLFLVSCKNYSKSTNPHKYLKFELLEDDTYAVIGFSNQTVKQLVIPSEHKNKPVSKINDNAFKVEKGIWGGRKSLPIETLDIEEGVKVIGEYAFYDSGLKDALLADSIEYIYDNAFYNNDTTINLPKNIKHVGSNAFAGTKLSGEINTTGINFENSALYDTDITAIIFSSETELIPEGICGNCDSLTKVEIPEGIKEIGSNAFSGCVKLNDIDLPKSLKIINSNAFSHSGLEEIVFKSEITNIGEYAFSSCENLKKVELPESSFTLGDSAFSYCRNLNEVIFGPSNDTYGLAFLGCPLKDMSVKADSAYEIVDGCLAIKVKDQYELVLGYDNCNAFDKFSKIQGYAFAGRSIEKLDIKNNVTSVERYAFYFAKIKEANIASEIVKDYAFKYSSINLLTISSKSIEKAFDNVYNLEKVIIEEGCEFINRDAFNCCFELKTVYLPASLKEIKTAAFIQCHLLTEVYYELNSGTPVRLYAGNFIEYKSNFINNGKVDVKLNDNFNIYVYEDIYNECVMLWSDMPTDELYNYHENLVDFIKVR